MFCSQYLVAVYFKTSLCTTKLLTELACYSPFNCNKNRCEPNGYYGNLAADPSAGGWKQISHIPVCVKARDNGYGHLLYYGESKLVGALKLKYASGEIR